MKKILSIIVIIISVTVLIFSIARQGDKKSADSKIKLAYIVYPPLIKKNPETNSLSGVSYDIAEAVSDRIGIEIEWTEEVGWGNSLEGLRVGRYDVLGTQMWPNKERLRVADFSNAPFESVLYPYVRKGDDRFDLDKELINSSGVRVSALDGEMAVFIALDDYPDAELKTLPQLSSYADVFLNIKNKRADITFAEPSAAMDFERYNPNSLKQLGSEPVRSFGNSFAFSKSSTLLDQWNKALSELKKEGVIEEILKAHGVENHYQY